MYNIRTYRRMYMYTQWCISKKFVSIVKKIFDLKKIFSLGPQIIQPMLQTLTFKLSFNTFLHSNRNEEQLILQLYFFSVIDFLDSWKRVSISGR